MLFILPQSEYDKVRGLFAPHAHHMVCMCGFDDPETVIVVDNPDSPQSALMVTWKCWGFLAGYPDNGAFNQSLNKALFDRKIISPEMWGLLLTSQPETWHAPLPDIVAPSALVPFPRKHFTTDHIQYNWQNAVPDGYQVIPLNTALLEHYPGIEIPDDVRKLLDVQDPLREGFGFAAVYNGGIAAHAMIDFIHGNEGEIGLHTQEAHRRKGLATVTSAASIEYGLSHGLELVRWECHAENMGSLKTAEKLGFKHEFDYDMHYFDF